ncbi:MAG TPA: tRNA (N6-isopentenyl adenosine(37)-C2)-methylthiotransferase MiaB [Candidatus Acutalibacter ornithocaccae]|uniref:tRNA-2-methylthio-N(6)-dimethylallyladenosine synthase n=1 Tax=Candidatus Acutalibacter ornithocaccae TaxID=2838416 RepID=A0A9D2LXK9_9FIRM|nr:tRNA (N6-isopentenyl adenosine(37)-C2)-methylthiotransferase MiaB [Candidatus Acutalibacter ornithocaccae]
MADVAEMMKVRARGPVPMAYVRTYGCQQNVADGEKIKGLLSEMGFSFAETPEEADFILFNTCAVREHAQDRVFGNVGALKNIKRRHPGTIIAVCGCMTEQEHVAERFKKSYPFVNIVFGTHVIHRLPEMLYTTLTDSKRVFLRGHEGEEVLEGIPTRRDGTSRAWVTVMLGCDNFCSYCIVPYVRGREKSRRPEEIVKECRQLIEAGYKEITLLGQNVNSYGKGLEEPVNFAELLRRIDAIPGDYRIRFMTSHPKDASRELFDVMAHSQHIPHYIHLPFQSGNDRVLREMNRRYTREQYLELIRYARSVMPDISFTSDVIVGFPGETYEEFQDTLSLIREVGFTSLFTFIYSPREGTRAAKMPDPVSREEKTQWFAELLKVQEEVAAQRSAAMVGQTYRVLVEERNEKSGLLSGRTASSVVIDFPGGEELIGQYAQVKVTAARSWMLSGELAE